MKNIKDTGQAGGGKIAKRLYSSWVIIKKSAFTKYFPMVVFLTFIQYFAQLVGFLEILKMNRYD